MSVMSVNETLVKRKNTHGDFAQNAATSQALVRVLRNGQSWGELTDGQRESLEMIAHKMARIVNGNPDFADHWHDIMGYSRLSEIMCSDFQEK